jgi:hypothetical protein
MLRFAPPRFSIQSVLVTCAVIAVMLAIIIRDARQRSRLLDHISSRGSVIYHDQWLANKTLAASPTPPGPKWLRNLLGDTYFRRPLFVSVHADEQLIYDICKLDDIEQLTILATSLTNPEALRPISNLPNLEALSVLHGSQLESLNLAHLRDSPIKRLHLEGLTITNSEMDHIESIDTLQNLTIKQTHIDQGEIDYLQQLRPTLNISFTEHVESPSLFP